MLYVRYMRLELFKCILHLPFGQLTRDICQEGIH